MTEATGAPHINDVLARAAPIDSNQMVEDPGQPYLLFDIYPLDLGPNPDFDVAEGTDVDGDGDTDIRGGILKATDGLAWGYDAWFARNFRRLVGVGAAGRGKTWFCGGYHFLQFLQDGARQAEYYVRSLQLAGWGGDDIVPIVDVEEGNERHPNRRASTAQVVDCCSAFSRRCGELTGRGVMLYGRGSMRDRGITSKMGCDRVWNPSYTERMELNGITALKFHGNAKTEWSLDDVALWQYGGDGAGSPRVHKLPPEIRGFGKVDMSVFVDGARAPTLVRLRERLL